MTFELTFAKAERAGTSSPSKMHAMMATAIRQTTTVAAAAITASGRPSRSAAVAARALAAASLSTAARDRSRSPSSSLSPVPPSPKDDYKEPEVANGKAAEAEEDEVVEEKPAKKKRTRKPKEPIVYVIPEVERLETTYKCVHESPQRSQRPSC